MSTTTTPLVVPGSGRPPSAPPPARSPLETIVSLLAVPALVVAGYFLLTWLRDTDANRALVVAVALVAGVGGVFVVYLLLDRVVDALPERWRETTRPWVYLGPALVLLSLFLLYPAVNILITSLYDATGQNFVGLQNYQFVFQDAAMLRSIRNTVAWMIVVPVASVGTGLVFAVLADRLHRGESLAKSLIFLPMAISFVGASVVWGFIYDFRPFGNQTGLMNGIWTALGNDAMAWLSWQPWNNLLLMVVMIWMQTGFAMVILSAAIKGVPEDILEAARIDGASELQIFRRITIPSIMSAIVVVTTTMVINVLKIFDIVYVMTSGDAGTEVIAERLIRWMFSFRNNGVAAAIASLLFVLVIPVMIWNVRRFRAEEETR